MTDGDRVLEDVVRRIRAGELRHVVGIVEEGDGADFIGVFLRTDDGKVFAVSSWTAHELLDSGAGIALVGENGNVAAHPSRCFAAPTVAEWLAHPWSKRPAPGLVGNIIQEVRRACV